MGGCGVGGEGGGGGEREEGEEEGEEGWGDMFSMWGLVVEHCQPSLTIFTTLAHTCTVHVCTQF